jgi:monoamine oxidase
VGIGVDFMTRQVVGGGSVMAQEQESTLEVAGRLLATTEEAVMARSSMGEFIDALPVGEAQRAVFRSRLQGSFGSDLHSIGLRMMVERSSPLRVGDGGTRRDDRYFRLADGNQSLATAMAARLPDVRLGHAVEEVGHGATPCTVGGRADSGSFEVAGDAVVVAVPVKLAAELDFRPPLPEDIGAAISIVPMGTAAKLAVGTAQPPSLRAIQDVQMPYWCWTGEGGDGRVRRALTAFCGSVESQRNLKTDSRDPGTWLGRMASANPDLDLVGDPLMVDWSQDEWSRGCYSAFDNPALDAISLLSEPVGRVFFAGEHTARDSGTMEGALASGIRAAGQVEGNVYR